MGKNQADASATVITPQRAVRLYRLLTLTAESARTRRTLLTRLRVDVRGFYRDLELLRGLGIEVALDGDKYQLQGDLDASLAKLPFPDPGLSLRDVLTLSRGSTDAHRKLRRKLDSFLGPNGHHAGG
jgi:predicted DNA-binding transcriptional regulator YafY